MMLKYNIKSSSPLLNTQPHNNNINNSNIIKEERGEERRGVVVCDFGLAVKVNNENYENYEQL